MTPFELAEPNSLRDALKLLNTDDQSVRAFGGCTALMLMMKTGVFQPTCLVSLRGVEPEHAAIQSDGGVLRIGALATLNAMQTLSNVRVRNVATLGGHLAHGDPHMDLPPVMIALDAELTATSVNGERTLAVADLFTGYYETALEKNELISEVRIPAQAGRRSAYLKCTTRTADDWPALGVAVSFATDGKVIQDARVVVSAATEKAVRLRDAEAVLNGATVSDAVLARAGEAAAAEAEVVGDARGSAAYKREMLRVYAARAVKQALAA
jgi:carbon-monoxide dehydrogenase medium subunit